MQPPKGYYKQLLPPDLSHVRLAFSNIPMSGVRKLDPAPVLAVLDALKSNQHARYYADGIRNGSILAVEEVGGGRYWAPGELFFRS
ncbi:MAG: hypothetical protein IT363_10035 [Methanoregulaceae archaeon]|nr:hypothetical protein [Methanoregulaceae archaeon]